MKCKVHTCCIVFGLRMGSLIIAYLGLIWNVICLWMVAASINASAKKSASSHDVRYLEKLKSDKFILIWVLTIFLLSLIFNIILIFGVHKRKRNCIEIYLIYTILFIVLGVGFGFIPSIQDGLLSPLEIVQRSIILVLSIYFFIVIWSYWLDLKDMRPHIPNTTQNKI